MKKLITLEKGNLRAQVYDGQLVSFSKKGREYMHGGGKPDDLKSERDKKGYNRSEFFMFPVCGPVYDGQIQVGDNIFPQDQHGISRLLPFRVLDLNVKDGYINLIQVYDGSKISNPKHRLDNDSPEYVRFLPFVSEKTIELQENKLKITFSLYNKSNTLMFFRCGWHPVFEAPAHAEDGLFEANQKEYYLDDVIRESEKKGGLPIRGADSIKFTNKRTGQSLELLSEGFRHVNLWSPGEEFGIVGIEPVTQPAVLKRPQNYFTSGSFEQLEPQHQKTYSVIIKV